ncbi:MAG: serine/threonine protein kinase [Pseudorhodobacter sp.]|nr:serine/threonine protein kinase [Frankiaceae bacterium]
MTTPEEPTQAVSVLVSSRYRLDALIGRGGTAEVWRATDTLLDRVVALKLVTVAHDASSARAADEARTLAQLSHPSLVQVYDAGTDDHGRPWVVMELVDGETLADAIRRRPLASERVAVIGAVVAEGLAHVHARGLVHRDVKPANVLVGRDGAVRLTDFGIARLVDSAKVTSTGLLVGTASYLAPEQVAGQFVGPPADVWSLGLLLIEALTGHREYDGGTVETAVARLARPPVVPTSLGAGWVALLTRMTAREPADRPTAHEAGLALRGLARGELTTVLPVAVQPVVDPPTRAMNAPVPGVAPTAFSQPEPPVRRADPQPRRSRTQAVVIAVLLLVIAGGAAGVVAAQGGRTATPRPVHTVAPTVPQPLRDELQRLVQTVQP